MGDIAVLKLCDSEEIDNNEYYYYVKKGVDFDEKLEAFKQLVATYENYQEVEDFIFDNFEQVNIDEYEIYY